MIIIVTNSTQNIMVNGTLSDRISHHLPVFQVTNLHVGHYSSKHKHVQYNDFSDSLFIEEISKKLPELEPSENFAEFVVLYGNILDKHCKLETPKITKRTPLNNPWITEGICTS